MNSHRIIPGLLIRLDRDQEAYDFCAWYMRNIDPTHPWDNQWEEDTTLPILDLHDADPSESVLAWLTHDAMTNRLESPAYVLLVLLRLSEALVKAVQLKRADPALSPPEVIETVKETCPSDILSRHPSWLAETDTIEKRHSAVFRNALILYTTIENYNLLYFRTILHPDGKESYRDSLLPIREPRSPYEAEMAFDDTHLAWNTSKWALDVLFNMFVDPDSLYN